jgi:hypothetical protein
LDWEFQVRALDGQLPDRPFAPARTRPWCGRVARFDTGEGLRVDVAQLAERGVAIAEVAGSKPVIRSKPF